MTSLLLFFAFSYLCFFLFTQPAFDHLGYFLSFGLLLVFTFFLVDWHSSLRTLVLRNRHAYLRPYQNLTTTNFHLLSLCILLMLIHSLKSPANTFSKLNSVIVEMEKCYNYLFLKPTVKSKIDSVENKRTEMYSFGAQSINVHYKILILYQWSSQNGKQQIPYNLHSVANKCGYWHDCYKLTIRNKLQINDEI